MFNELTSWDAYSEEDEDIVTIDTVTENTKIFIQQKYRNYVNDLLTVCFNFSI